MLNFTTKQQARRANMQVGSKKDAGEGLGGKRTKREARWRHRGDMEGKQKKSGGGGMEEKKGNATR